MASLVSIHLSYICIVTYKIVSSPEHNVLIKRSCLIIITAASICYITQHSTFIHFQFVIIDHFIMWMRGNIEILVLTCPP